MIVTKRNMCEYLDLAPYRSNYQHLRGTLLTSPLGSFEAGAAWVDNDCDTTESAPTMREDRIVPRMTTSECFQHHTSIGRAAVYSKHLRSLAHRYQFDLEHATWSMKMKVFQINQALASHSHETILDNPVKFQAFVWPFGEEMRAGIRRWCEIVDDKPICG